MTERKRRIAPSVLAANFAELGQAVSIAEKAGADWLHLDVMDGNFVPPITFGAQTVQALRSLSSLPLDTHLMTVHPAQHIDAFIEAGSDRVTFHLEAEIHAHRLLGALKERKVAAGVAIVPSTPVSALKELLPYLDQVLVMTVNPGWGGQAMIPSTLKKIEELAALRTAGAGDYLIAMDGGFSPKTASKIWEAGADMAVMGSAFYGAEDPSNAMKEAREA